MDDTRPLHLCHVQKSSIIINRSHAFLNFMALTVLIYYRASFLIQTTKTSDTRILLLPYVLVFASELILSFLWVLDQPFRWRPVYRTVYPERLPPDDELPAIDVFICTADPNKEPTVEVMNTVISAMALDYPPDKLYVYVSDDGGSSLTLNAMREAWRFAKWWLPFCRKFGIKSRCPEAYFSAAEDDHIHRDVQSCEFIEEKEKVKKKYEVFTESVMKIIENEGIRVNHDHTSVVEVINDQSMDAVGVDKTQMPLLVYVSREKRPSHPHHFKAGALNVLLRVSSMISNSRYVLTLDCDMYCNDPKSARQAMCFHLDSNLSPSLAFVQFPQKFHNISDNDIYNSQLRSAFTIWQGLDGLVGPILSGTGFYINRGALYGISVHQDIDLVRVKHSFGASDEFIKSLSPNYKAKLSKVGDFHGASLQETKVLASCAYEKHTKWGKEVGFRYFSVVEDYFTGFNLHCKGWISVYFDPPRPAFLGAATTNLNDVLVQDTRWSSGLAQVGISSFSPLIYGLFRMSVLGSMCYAELAFYPFYCFPMWCLATIPQLCLVIGIPLYPEVKSSFFLVFLFIFVSSHLKHIREIFLTGHSIRTWSNEQRIWMIKSVTSYLYGTLNAVMETMGIQEASFLPTNKVVDNEQFKRYQKGTFDFQASTMFLYPLCTLVILNVGSLIGGVLRVILTGSCNAMFIQLFLSFFIVTMSYPVIEGMVLRKDKGRIPPSVTNLSFTLVSTLLSALTCLVVMYIK